MLVCGVLSGCPWVDSNISGCEQQCVPKSRTLAHPLDWLHSAEAALKFYAVAQKSNLAVPMPCAWRCSIDYKPMHLACTLQQPHIRLGVTNCLLWLTLTTLPFPESASGTSTVGMRALPFEGLAARSVCDLLWLRLILMFADSSMQLKLQAWHQASLLSGMCVDLDLRPFPQPT